MGLIQFIIDAGFVGWCILFTGICAAALIVERVQTLYYKYSMNSKELASKVEGLVMANKVDEAIVLCAQFENKPFAKAFKTILEKSDRDDEALYQAQDIAFAENIPQFSKRLHYLSMLANVATLMGLLGTIHGLILSFQAVALADPAQKQALLASGISVSMYTTALGLAVSIPVMIAFSILVSKQNSMIEEVTEKTSRLIELLTSTTSYSLVRKNVFPDNINAEVVAGYQTSRPPSGNSRAS